MQELAHILALQQHFGTTGSWIESGAGSARGKKQCADPPSAEHRGRELALQIATRYGMDDLPAPDAGLRHRAA